MKTTLLPLAVGLAAWFLLAVMVGVTFQSSTPARSAVAPTVVKKPSPTPPPQLVMNE